MLKLTEYQNYQSSQRSTLSDITMTPPTDSLVEHEFWIKVNKYHYFPLPVQGQRL